MYKEKDVGFGFTLAAGSTSIGFSHIRSILREPALSADLKHWDRILSVNQFNCQTITHRDLVARLRYTPTGPAYLILYRPRIDEIVHAKERSRHLRQRPDASVSVDVCHTIILPTFFCSLSLSSQHAHVPYMMATPLSLLIFLMFFVP